MTPIRRLTLLFAALQPALPGVARDATAQSPHATPAATQRGPVIAAAPFGVGEVLEYGIAYAFLDAGTLRLEVEEIEAVDGRPAYRLASRAQTNRAVSTLYSLKDHLQSWMDVERLHSLRFEKESVEKGKHRDSSWRLDHERGVRVDFPLDLGDLAPKP